MSKTRHRINERIRAREVRLIDQAGKQMGIYSLREALQMARERNLDLVEVAPRADPPVCRLMDYGKYIYERTKREREARKAQKTTEMKEIRLRPKTDEYHIGFKLKRAREFLSEGAKVKVRVLFRGREITHPEIGLALLKKVAAELEDIATVEHQPRFEGRSMLMILSPLSGKR
ncbi:MAG: translation initiation factor IF-3 [Anaerolineae bacterium]